MLLRIFTITVYLPIDRRKLYWCWNRRLTTDSIYHCFNHHSECSSLELINLKKYNLHKWVIKITDACWTFLISALVIFRKTFAEFTVTANNFNFITCQFYGRCNAIFHVISSLWTNVWFNWSCWPTHPSISY